MKIKTRNTAAALAALIILLPGAGTAAPSAEELDKRLTVLERRMENAALPEMSNEMQVLRREVQQLRGELDLLKREIAEIKQRQRDLYMDVDGRLQELEAARTAPPPADGQTPDESMAGNGGGSAPPASGGNGGASAGGNGQAGGNGGEQSPEAAYRSAFDTLKAGRYDQAAQAFQTFLEQHPQSTFADNARYWLGESYYVVRSFDEAMTHFRQLLDEFPESAKRPDALLKIGFIQYENGDMGASRETLQQVLEQYPDSTAASLAQQRLDRIAREN
ncbi:tol-pal system protein YbgF [Ectothiorhodospiraceae bacterium WFHF3C12]|nr:tol-pal system protein YbgF [Ectothiorhodospiraceae bacterium WFHF3C12]